MRRKVLRRQQFPNKTKMIQRVEIGSGLHHERNPHHVPCQNRITTGVKPDFPPRNAQTIEDLWKHAIITKSAVTTTRLIAAITVWDFLSTGLKDVASGIEVSLTALFDSNLAHLELSEPGREYLIDSAPMHKRTPIKNYICFNCMVERCFKRCTCKAKICIW